MAGPIPTLVGIADKVVPAINGNPAVPTDIRGLRQMVLAYLFPLDLTSFSLALLFPQGAPLYGRVELITETAQSYAIDYRMEIDGHTVLPYRALLGFSHRNNEAPAILWQPGKVTIWHERDGIRDTLGAIEFVFAQPNPLTVDQLLAIQSNPSKRDVRLEIACIACRDGITPYAAVERISVSPLQDAPNPVWYQDLEGTFTCSCGRLTFPLKYLREGLLHLLWSHHAMLPGRGLAVSSAISLDEAERTLRSFEELLANDPVEEQVQTYIEQNPILLAPFAARHVFFKPPILNKWRADFGVVNAQNELILIEIERPDLPLFTKEGIQRSELTQAFSQPQTWDQEMVRYRSAVLSGIAGCPSDVARVRYLVIAGRSNDENQEAIARTISSSRGHDFMTYDHLIEAVRNAVRSVTA
jgi:hypothetical protein